LPVVSVSKAAALLPPGKNRSEHGNFILRPLLFYVKYFSTLFQNSTLESDAMISGEMRVLLADDDRETTEAPTPR
jgi:hypothetical protein